MKNERYYLILLIFLVIAGVFLVAQVLFFQQPTRDTSEQLSTFSLTPTTTTKQNEPIVNSWKTYSNEKYHVSFAVPDGWKVQDYAQSYPNGGTVVAFSPDPLPCATCSYFQNGFFSMKIYNQKTDPDYYNMFTQRMKAAGKNKEYQLVNVGNSKGVAFANTITLENQGWVYELSLDTNEGKIKFTDSKIFQHVASSLAFNDLLFGE